MKLKILVALFLTLGSLGASAQILKSVYFVDGVATRHQLNPAFAPRSGYFGIPMLGNFGLSINSNVGMGTFLYPNQDGEFNTFLHKDVGNNEFLDKLNSNNVLDANINLNILQFGFYAWGGFNSFDINVKSNTYTTLPKDMFTFLKSGMSNPEGNTYDFSDVGVNTQNYIDVVLGHSRQINDKIRVGVKLKAMLGVVNAYTHFNDLTLSMSEEKWMISGDGELVSSGLEFETDESGEITGADMGDIGLNGLGFAFDAGVTYQLKDDIELSLAVLDIGFMKWDNSVKGYMKPGSVVYDGFNDISVSDDDDENDDKSFDDQMDQLTDDVEKLFTFYEMKDISGGIENKQSTSPTLNVGAEYVLSKDKFSVGLLSSTLFREKFTVSDVMLSANYSPAKWFDLTAHTSVSNIGWTWGGLLNFSPKDFNFFIGTTVVSSKFSPQIVPVGELIVNVNFGFNVLLRRNKKKKVVQDNIILTLDPVVIDRAAIDSVADSMTFDSIAEPTNTDIITPLKQEEVKEIDSDTLSNSGNVIVGSFKSNQKTEQLQEKIDFMGFEESVILIKEVAMYGVCSNSYSTHFACWGEVFETRKKAYNLLRLWDC